MNRVIAVPQLLSCKIEIQSPRRVAENEVLNKQKDFSLQLVDFDKKNSKISTVD